MSRTRFCFVAFASGSLALVFACNGGEDRPDASPQNGETDAARQADAGFCTEYDVIRLCIRGEATDDGEELEAGEPVSVQLYPEGCHSSSCSIVEEAACAADLDGGLVAVEGSFCIAEDIPDDGACTPDCAGGGTAECDTEETLEEGEYTATLDNLTVEFSVPSELPHGGACAHREE